MNVSSAANAPHRCAVCDTAGTPWIEKDAREMLRCPACGFAWIAQGVKRTASGASIYENASPVFFGDEFADYYRDETSIAAARAKLAWVRSMVPGGRLLDIGANFGLFVREAAKEYDAVGIEPSAAVVARARSEFHAPLEQGSVYDDIRAFDGRFDAITLFDVIEHLPYPALALEQCHRWLSPGGYLFVTTPDIGSLMARVLGRHWYYIDMDEHISLFNDGSLRLLLDRAGFTVRDRRTVGREYRFSYIERRLRYLAQQGALLRVAHLLSQPLRLLPTRRVTLNFGDVMAIAARRD